MLYRSIFLAAALTHGLAQASPPRDGDGPLLPVPQYMVPFAADMVAQINYQYSAQLQALHDEGIAVRQADGGTLTPAHRAELQAKLDRLNATYLRRIGLYDTVDALGRRK